MATRQYIGARYVPIFADPVQWSNDRAYEALMMVQSAGETYITKQATPIGAQLPDISQGEEDNAYWVHMSNWNAQIEQYREEVLQYNGRISALEVDLPIVSGKVDALDLAVPAISNRVTALEKIEAEKSYLSVEDYMTEDNTFSDALQACIDDCAVKGKKFVKLNSPVYTLDDTVTINQPITIFADPRGDNQTVIVCDDTVSTAFHVTSTHVGFYDFAIIGTIDHNEYTIAVDFDIADCNIDAKIVNMDFFNLFTAIRFYGRNIDILGGIISHCDVGIHLRDVAGSTSEIVRGIVIDGVRFHNCGATRQTGGISYQNGTTCIYSDILNHTSYPNMQIINNYCDLGTRFFEGVLGQGTISNNYIESHHNHEAIKVVNMFRPSPNSTIYKSGIISNNVIIGSSEGDAGISVENGHSYHISDIYLSGHTDYSIKITDSNYVMLDAISCIETNNNAIYVEDATCYASNIISLNTSAPIIKAQSGSSCKMLTKPFNKMTLYENVVFDNWEKHTGVNIDSAVTLDNIKTTDVNEIVVKVYNTFIKLARIPGISGTMKGTAINASNDALITVIATFNDTDNKVTISGYNYTLATNTSSAIPNTTTCDFGIQLYATPV